MSPTARIGMELSISSMCNKMTFTTHSMSCTISYIYSRTSRIQFTNPTSLAVSLGALLFQVQ